MGYYRNDLIGAASGYGGSSHGGGHGGGCYCPQPQNNDFLILAAAALAAFLLIPLITMMRRRKRRGGELEDDNLGHVVSWVYAGKQMSSRKKNKPTDLHLFMYGGTFLIKSKISNTSIALN